MSGSCEMTTPAAWVDAWRASPSSERATVHQLIDSRIGVDQFFQSRLLLQRAFQGNVELIGNKFGDLVDFGIRDFHHAADIADGRFGAERAKRNNLAHMIVAVFVDHVIDDFAAPVHAEIHIDIRQRDALRIEESLEQQTIDEWIEIGNP